MSLGALQIGRSGLLASQTALEVTGNNLANMATRGYHRQVVTLAPMRSQNIGSNLFVGRGVQVMQITRTVNEALEARLRSSIADESRSAIRQEVLSQIEAIYNELSDHDLSTQLGEFFNAWSRLALNPRDNSMRSLVLQEGSNLASHLKQLRSELSKARMTLDQSIEGAVVAANDLLKQLESLNQAIAVAHGAQGGAAGLRDQRSALLEDLARYLDISTVEHQTGMVDIFVGSTPIMLGGRSLGLDIRKRTVDGDLKMDVVLGIDGTVLDSSTGQLGAMVAARRDDLTGTIDFLDNFTNQLIFEINKVYSQGQGLEPFSSLAATNRVLDTTVALNDPDSGLNFTPVHGSFRVHVVQASTGQRTSYTIHVDLDGINPGADTTLDSLAADLGAIPGLNVTIGADGRLKIDAAASDIGFTFSDDTSGVLAALGINTFFTGSSALDVAVNSVIDQNPALMAVGRDHAEGDNRNALAIAAMANDAQPAFKGLSVLQYWNRHIEDLAVRTAQATNQREADTIVRENLQQQQQQISGVNADEETINLLAYQRAYQGSARFISIVDEMMQTLLSML